MRSEFLTAVKMSVDWAVMSFSHVSGYQHFTQQSKCKSRQGCHLHNR